MLYFIFYKLNLSVLSPNVLGNWCFASLNKGLRSIEPKVRAQGWQNVVDQNTTQSVATAVFVA